MRESLREVWARVASAAWLPYCVATCVVLWALWPVPFQLPIGQDHAHHYLATAVFVDDLLASGHWTGWTHRVGTGLPFGDVYGSLIYFVTGALRIVTFGLVPLAASYAFGILLVWLVPALAIVAWARRLGAGRFAAVLAVAAFVLDPGADREGGWVYSMFHAVWPQLFATGMLLWAIIALFRLAERPTWRRIGVAALLVGTSVWAHPMNALNLVVVTPIAVWVLVTARDRDGQVAVTPWLLLALGVGAAIAFGWFSHMVAAGSSIASYSAYGTPFPDVASGLLSGTLFENQLPIVGLTGLLGVFAAAMMRRAEGLFSLLVVGATLTLSSMLLFSMTDLGLAEGNPLVMYRRFVMTAKPLWFALVGLGATAAWRGVQALAESQQQQRGLAIIASAFFVAAALYGASALVPGPVARPLTALNAGLADDLTELTQLLRGLEVGQQRRVGLLHQRGESSDYALFAIADAGLGKVESRGVPCHALRWDNAPNTVAEMARVGVTHIITRHDRALAGTKLIGSAGTYHVREVTLDVQPPVWVEGGGEATITRWDPMRVEVELHNVDRDAQLVVAMAPFPKWRLQQGDDALQITHVEHAGQTFIGATGLTDGALELQFHDTTFEKLCFALMCVLLLLCIVAIALGDREPPALLGRRDLMRRVVLATMVGAALALVVVGLVASGRGLERAYPGAISVLHRGAVKFDYTPNPYCVRPFSRNPRVGCTERAIEPSIAVAPRRGNQMPSCMRFGVPDKGTATLTFDLPRDAKFVRGRLHHVSGRIEATGSAGGEAVRLIEKPFVVEVTADKIRVEATNAGNTATACLELVATTM